MTDAKTFMCIDPGVNTGWAVYNRHSIHPVHFGSFHSSKKIHEERHVELMIKFDELIAKNFFCLVDCVYIESVEYWSGNLTSQTATARGDLFTLAYVAGGYAAICQQNEMNFKFIPARLWKGQLTKEAVELRVKRVLPNIKFKNTHSMDAVAMGLSLLDVL